MKTLLDKVQTIEQKAAAIVEQAEEVGMQQLREIQTNEEQVLTDIKKKAQGKAEEIIAEYVGEAQAEISRIRQDEKQAVKIIQEAAAKNRGRALQKARQLFEEEYLA